jgi:hypothetical protein
MPTYTIENFDQSVLPGTFKKDLRDIIGVALTLGWKIITSRKQVINLVSPDGEQSERIGVSNANRVDLQRLRRKIVKYADPAMRDAAAEFIETATVSSVLGDVPAKAVMKEAARGIIDPEPEAHIISEGPMLARGGAGRGYESPTTIERRWSDGSRDYKCTDCDETSPERLSISRHFANVHSRGKGRQPSPPEFKAEVDAAGYRPNKRRIEALAEVIADLLREGETDAKVIAEIALTWVHEQHGTTLSTEAEPMSPEDTLNRIRALLDDGTFRAQQRRLEELETQVVTITAEAETYKERAHRAYETLRTFTELASEFSEEEEAG